MSIFIDRATRLLVQGVTGRDGSFHTRQMIAYGTHVVAGVTPGKGGSRFDGVVPVYDTVAEAVRDTQPNATVIYVPAAAAASAIYEAADAGLTLIICITEGIPVLDMTRVIPFLTERRVRLIGPNCPGLITPGAEQGGHHPRQHLPAGPDRRRLAQRHSHLRDRAISSRPTASANPRAWESGATRSSARRSSPAWPPSRRTPGPMRS